MENIHESTSALHVLSSRSATAQNVQSWMVSGAAVVGGSTSHAAERRGRKAIPKAKERMMFTVENIMLKYKRVMRTTFSGMV